MNLKLPFTSTRVEVVPSSSYSCWLMYIFIFFSLPRFFVVACFLALLIIVVMSDFICSKFVHVLESIICRNEIFYSEYVQMELFLNFCFPTEMEDHTCSPKALEEEHVKSALITSKFQRDIRTEACSNKIQQCMICLCSFEHNESVSRSKSCRHTFHTLCYKEWIMRQDCHSCPYCRCDIFEYETSDGNDTNTAAQIEL
jgi:hypothetical protein